MSASVVQPARLVSPRYADSTRAAISGTSAVVASRKVRVGPVSTAYNLTLTRGRPRRDPGCGPSRSGMWPAARVTTRTSKDHNPDLGASGGGADHQVGRQEPRARGLVRIGDGLEQHVDHGAAHRVRRLVDAGEAERGRDRGVVEADHRDIVRDGPARVAQDAD